jgi:hypothetical protein
VKLLKLRRASWTGTSVDINLFVSTFVPGPVAAQPLPLMFTYREARQRGLSKRALYAMRDRGELEVLSRGLYRQVAALMHDEELWEIATRAPLATLCLGTALSRHGLADEIQRAFDVALPRGLRTPAVSCPVRWHQFDRRTIEVGRERVVLEGGVAIGLYSPARCVVDAFRTRGREGHDVAYEALRRWLRQPGSQPSDLLDMAGHFPRMVSPIRHALEVLL